MNLLTEQSCICRLGKNQFIQYSPTARRRARVRATNFMMVVWNGKRCNGYSFIQYMSHSVIQFKKQQQQNMLKVLK